jgi:hypothetical protein
VNYDTNGWLAVTVGPLECLDNTIKTMKDIANKTNKDPNNFRVVLLAQIQGYSQSYITKIIVDTPNPYTHVQTIYTDIEYLL